jgi:tetratricopeptide (TPR) repeat protein
VRWLGACIKFGSQINHGQCTIGIPGSTACRATGWTEHSFEVRPIDCVMLGRKILPTLRTRSCNDCEVTVADQASRKADLFWDLISKAHDLSLLDSVAGEWSVGGTHFSLHPVICDWLQLRVRSEAVRDMVYEAIEIVMDSVRQINGAVHRSLQMRIVLLGHVDTCLENDRRFSPDRQRLGQGLSSCGSAAWLASFYDDHGRYGVAESLLRRILDTRRTTVGVEDPSTLTSMNNLAEALRYQGKYEEAEEMHRETLRLSKVSGEEHPETLTSMNNLALALMALGKYEEAEEMHLEKLQLRKKVMGKEHPSTLTSMYNLAYLLALQSRFVQAAIFYDRAVTNLFPLISSHKQTKAKGVIYPPSPV